MRVRAIDADHDWLFGKGQNDYVAGVSAIAQNINTRLNAFLGDCFFDNGAGIDWFNLLGNKDQTALNLAISAVILNTQDVTGLVQISINLDAQRMLTVQYTVSTARLTNVSDLFILTTPGTRPNTDVVSKNFFISFSDEQTKDINVGIYGLDAERCMVEVLDSLNNYQTDQFDVTRPDMGTIRLTAGGNITGTFRVLIFQAGA